MTEGGRPVHVATSADPQAFMGAFLGALRTGGPRANPFTIADTLEVRWDGDACRVVGDAPVTAGMLKITLVNTTQQDVTLAMGSAVPPEDLGRRRRRSWATLT